MEGLRPCLHLAELVSLEIGSGMSPLHWHKPFHLHPMELNLIQISPRDGEKHVNKGCNQNRAQPSPVST